MSWNRKKQDLADAPEKVLSQAFRYLGRKEYTATELRQRLRERGADRDVIDEALEYLQQHGYQDDGRAAEFHIRQRKEFAPRGRMLVRQELRERGVSSELSEILLEEQYPASEEKAVLLRYYGNSLHTRTSSAEERQKLWLKLARRAAAKGFGQGLIIEVLGEHLPDVEMEE